MRDTFKKDNLVNKLCFYNLEIFRSGVKYSYYFCSTTKDKVNECTRLVVGAESPSNPDGQSTFQEPRAMYHVQLKQSRADRRISFFYVLAYLF